MRWAAKAPQNHLEWNILDVAQEEWGRRLAAVVLLVVLGSLAGGLVGYGVWRRAQDGIARIEGDVANAVKLERLMETGQGPVPALGESVQAVELLGDAAQATVLVTRTLGVGGLSVQPELRFYVQTTKGWQRSDPIAGFWGPTETLDTAHLHFIFGRRDRMVVEQVALGAEAVYTVLRRATDQYLAGSGQITIEIVPDVLSQDAQTGGGRIRITSPALYPAAEQEHAGILGRLLRLVLSRRLLAAAQRTAVKQQWQPLLQGLGAWLIYTSSMPFAPDDEAGAQVELRSGLQSAWHLDALLDDKLRYDPQSQSIQAFTLISDPEQQKQRAAAAEQLFDYMAGVYGIDVLPRLLQGLAQYDDWEELAPAVFGISPVGLEDGWHTAMREGAPSRTFR